MASVLNADGKSVPGVAPAAMQMARYASAVIAGELKQGKRRRPPFAYHDKGSLATIGRSSGVAQMGRLHLSGFVAWLMWLVIHLVFLIGFRNKISVLMQWAYSYFTYRRGARIITGLDSRPAPSRRGHE
jgi:NADH dehydrogenase